MVIITRHTREAHSAVIDGEEVLQVPTELELTKRLLDEHQIDLAEYDHSSVGNSAAIVTTWFKPRRKRYEALQYRGRYSESDLVPGRGDADVGGEG